MIDKFEDLELYDAEHKPLSIEMIEVNVKEKLNITFAEMQRALSESVLKRVTTLVHDFVNIAPHGDYSKLMEDHDSIVKFLQDEAHKSEHWKLSEIEHNKHNPLLITFTFNNKSVDDGANLQGFVFVSFAGKIKHAFPQVDR